MNSIIHPLKTQSQMYTLKDFSQNFIQTFLPAKECKINCIATSHTGSYTFRVILPYNQSLTPYSSFSLAVPSPPPFVTHPVTFHFQMHSTGSYIFTVIVLYNQSLSHFPLPTLHFQVSRGFEREMCTYKN